MQPGISPAESWDFANQIGGVVFAVMVLALIAFAMVRASRK